MFRRAARGPAPLRGTSEGEMLRKFDVAGTSTDEITAEDLPRMVADAAACEPGRIAVTHGADTTTYARLNSEVVKLDAAMGILLGQASLVPIALATVFPALADTARGDLRDVLDALVIDLVECVAPEPLSAAG
ncbi:non-ribosomal peptide synthetase [Rhodococcus gordoniae]